MNQDIYTYLHQLQQALQTQQAAILNLEDRVRQLQEELNELKNRPSSSVGKVEYKFDQLKSRKFKWYFKYWFKPIFSKRTTN